MHDLVVKVQEDDQSSAAVVVPASVRRCIVVRDVALEVPPPKKALEVHNSGGRQSISLYNGNLNRCGRGGGRPTASSSIRTVRGDQQLGQRCWGRWQL